MDFDPTKKAFILDTADRARLGFYRDEVPVADAGSLMDAVHKLRQIAESIDASAFVPGAARSEAVARREQQLRYAHEIQSLIAAHGWTELDLYKLLD